MLVHHQRGEYFTRRVREIALPLRRDPRRPPSTNGQRGEARSERRSATRNETVDLHLFHRRNRRFPWKTRACDFAWRDWQQLVSDARCCLSAKRRSRGKYFLRWHQHLRERAGHVGIGELVARAFRDLHNREVRGDVALSRPSRDSHLFVRSCEIRAKVPAAFERDNERKQRASRLAASPNRRASFLRPSRSERLRPCQEAARLCVLPSGA